MIGAAASVVLASSAMVAFLSPTAPPASRRPATTDASSTHPEAPAPRKDPDVQSAPTRAGTEPAVVETAAPIEEVPTIEQVKAARLPRMAPNPQVAHLGIDAVAGKMKCKKGQLLVKDGRDGPGGLGCVRISYGRIIEQGHWVHRLPNDRLEAGLYDEGRRVGLWITYSPAGAVLERGTYDQGNRVGAWDEYSEEGLHLARRSYDRGAFHGVSVLYHRQQPMIEVYDRGELVSSENGFETARRVADSRAPQALPHSVPQVADSPSRGELP